MQPSVSDSALVRFEDVRLAYGERVILDRVSLTIDRGELVYLVGRTGAGKSTLLRALYADLKPVAGLLRVGPYDLMRLRASDRPYLRRSLGIVFQDFQLLTDRSVGANISFAMRATGWRDSRKIKQRLLQVLMQVGLASRVNDMPHQLSGGEQQRTVIARALVNDPFLIIADEPTGNLDPEVAEHIHDLLIQIHQAGTAVLIATHQPELIRRYPSRVIECAEQTVRERQPHS
jgi:cell division transport system ATP-binding protein